MESFTIRIISEMAEKLLSIGDRPADKNLLFVVSAYSVDPRRQENYLPQAQNS
jgi:hypothetical protein